MNLRFANTNEDNTGVPSGNLKTKTLLMKIHLFSIFLLGLVLFCSCQQPNETVKHVKVYYQPGHFGGWPANNGIWAWDNEILVGFSMGYYKNLGPQMHNIDRERPEVHLLARSLDGGESWNIEDPAKDGVMIARGKALHGIEPDSTNRRAITALQEPMDFLRPGFAMKFWMLDVNTGPSIFYYTYDKGHSWKGPFSLSADSMTKISARNDYMVEDSNSCMAFFTAAKSNDKEGRVFCSRTDDGGLSWQFIAWVGPEPEKGFRIMPSTVRISENGLYLTSRVRHEPGDWNELKPGIKEKSRFIDSWLSNDNGRNWKYVGKPVDDLGEGNPPCLIKLADGRLCLTYGNRAEPYSICAKLSNDNGISWSAPIVLRNDGDGRDIGYVRSVQRPDGKVVTIYYFQDKEHPERFIGCTIWNPDVAASAKQ
jgi:hypothetical protein